MPTSNFLQFLPLVVDSLSFGIYTALFVQCLHLLYHTRRAHYRLYSGAMCALYLLSTLHIVLAFTWAAITDTADYAIYEVFSLKHPLPVLFRPGDPPVVRALATLIKARWVVSNGIADAVLIHRLYIIWGRNWKSVALPLASYSLTMVSAVADVMPLPPTAARTALIVAMGGVFLTNVLSSALTAGRIWFMSRSFTKLVGIKRRKRYTELMVIMWAFCGVPRANLPLTRSMPHTGGICRGTRQPGASGIASGDSLESGLIYPALLLITIVVFVAPPTPTVAVLSCIAVVYHIVGIAPTLIIVRVSLGVNEDEEAGPFPRSLPGLTNLNLNTTDNTSRLTTLRFAVPETVASPDEPLELNFRVKGTPV